MLLICWFFLNLCSHCCCCCFIFLLKGLCALQKEAALKNNHYYYYYLDILQKRHHTLANITPAHTQCLFSIDLHTVRHQLVIAHFLLLLSRTLFQMVSGLPHHCQHFILICKHTCLVQLTKTEPFILITVHVYMVWPCYIIFVSTSLKNVLMSIKT